MTTSPARRSFGPTPEELADPIDGPEFDLLGETFHCVPVAPAATLNALSATTRADPRGREIYSAPDLIEFMRGVICEERWTTDLLDDEDRPVAAHWVRVDDIARFERLMSDKRRSVGIQVLGEIVTWLTAVYTERPTTRPSR